MAREHDSMNDDTIGRALREALDVTPSPDFVARVRTRIASEPVPRSLWNRWTVWTPVTVGAVAAAIALAVWVEKPAVLRVPDTTIATADVRLPPSPLRGLGETRTPDTTTATVHVGSGFPSLALRTGRRTVKEPQILISQSESAALRRLIARAGEGQIVVDVSMVSLPDATVDADIALKPLPETPPLKIDPIVPVNGEEGVRQ